MRRAVFLISLAAFVALSAPSLFAAELEGVTMDDSVQVGDHTLVLNGLGLRKKLWVKVYVGGLYLPAKEKDGAKVLAADGPRRTVMHFLYKVGQSKLCEGWDEGLENNTSGASAQTKGDFKKLCDWMEDVVPGDRVVFTYSDGKTDIEVKGKSKGAIEGKAFADALFACWLGPKPPSDDFKDGMLGK